ncbi:DUF523 domain-containing protein [Stutzerimonas balearica]|jgi:uncharacterized protein YbbK (DUF523 family)|uniref:DUF523 domain-containing protein n=1 Tax=Stutzerimonas balearica TaxID=74829 RepID=UPI003F769D1F
MKKVLVSSCLLGCKVRYNAGALNLPAPALEWLETHVELVAFCPEVAAGLPTPRPPAEIRSASGQDVLAGRDRVIDISGQDVTDAFLDGARQALARCMAEGIRHAILTESSPSCGSSSIYDGTFSGIRKAGMGVTAALLSANGIRVYSQHELDRLIRELG